MANKKLKLAVDEPWASVGLSLFISVGLENALVSDKRLDFLYSLKWKGKSHSGRQKTAMVLAPVMLC